MHSRILRASYKSFPEFRDVFRNGLIRNLSSSEESCFVTIVEVGPRDGLQNEKQIVSTDKKITLIDKLSETGLTRIEATSFVSAQSIPQLSDGDEVLKKIQRKPTVIYSALVPTLKHFERALASNVHEVAFFAAASETFSQTNIRCSIKTSLQRAEEIMKLCTKNDIRVRGYVSCVVGCPYEGRIEPEAVLKLSEKLLDMGCFEVSLGDTIGIGTPGEISSLLTLLLRHIKPEKLALHCHDTYGQALANIFCALKLGIRTFDSSISGLGGCPYAKGASGNISTEDLLYMLNGLGYKTNVDLAKLLAVSEWLSVEVLMKAPMSKVAMAKFGSQRFKIC